jgi:hypothetical protein
MINLLRTECHIASVLSFFKNDVPFIILCTKIFGMMQGFMNSQDATLAHALRSRTHKCARI